MSYFVAKMEEIMSENKVEEIVEEKAPVVQHDASQISKGKQRLELILTQLYNHPTDRFYAYLFFQVDRIMDNKNCPTMGVGLQQGRIKLLINSMFLETLTDYQAVEILKHEALHLINDHLVRGKGAKEKDMLKAKMENIAMDCAINQYLDAKVIEEIGMVNLERFREVLKHKPKEFVLEPKMTAEYYYDLLQQEKEDREEEQGDDEGQGEGQGSGGLGGELGDLEMDSHDMFGDMDALDRAMLEDKIKKAAGEAKANGVGNLPSEVEELLALRKKPQVNWKRELKRFFGDGIRSDKRSTRSKRNRRYAFKVAGKKKDYHARILVVLDTSGSMYGDRTEKVLNEIYGIWKDNKTTSIDICECDAEIKDVFEYNGKGKFKITGRGGTYLTPALKYAKENKYDGVIFLTDGEFYGEEFEKYKKLNSLWIIAGNESYTSTVGRTVHLK